MNRISIAVLAALALAGCRAAEAMPARALAAEADTTPGREARSAYRTWRDGECEFGWETANTRFLVVGSGAVEGQPHLVLEETTETRACDNHEGRDVKVRVVARPAARPDAGPVWTLAAPGDEAQVWFDQGYALYRVRLFGCCDLENTDFFHDLSDGRLRFSASAEPLRLEAPAFSGAYVAFHGSNAAEEPTERESDRTVAGVFQLAPDGRGAVQRAVLHAPAGVEDAYAASGFRLLSGEGADTASSTFMNRDDGPLRAVLTLERVSGEVATGPERLEIPIENGRLAIDKARLPAGMRLVAAP